MVRYWVWNLGCCVGGPVVLFWVCNLGCAGRPGVDNWVCSLGCCAGGPGVRYWVWDLVWVGWERRVWHTVLLPGCFHQTSCWSDGVLRMVYSTVEQGTMKRGKSVDVGKRCLVICLWLHKWGVQQGLRVAPHSAVAGAPSVVVILCSCSCLCVETVVANSGICRKMSASSMDGSLEVCKCCVTWPVLLEGLW